jgi:hypothetical protein
MKITWLDRMREPKCEPDPAFPDGKDIDGALGIEPFCKADLPYPAKRCGVYVVQCERCGYTIALTTAGRPDDPRSVTIPCKSLPN